MRGKAILPGPSLTPAVRLGRSHPITPQCGYMKESDSRRKKKLLPFKTSQQKHHQRGWGGRLHSKHLSLMVSEVGGSPSVQGLIPRGRPSSCCILPWQGAGGSLGLW